MRLQEECRCRTSAIPGVINAFVQDVPEMQCSLLLQAACRKGSRFPTPDKCYHLSCYINPQIRPATSLSVQTDTESPVQSSISSDLIDSTSQVASIHRHHNPTLNQDMPPKRRLRAPEPSEPSGSSKSPEPTPKPTPKGTKESEQEKKPTSRGVKKDGTPTGTARIYAILRFESTKARALQAEHIRTLIRQSGCTGVKHENVHNLMYTILFGDETTLLHFRQFQGMWEYRSLSPAAGGPRAEWWAAFRWFLRDCISKVKTQINKSGYSLPQTYSDEVGKLMPALATSEGDNRTKGKGRSRGEEADVPIQATQPVWPLAPSINLLSAGGEGRYGYQNDPPPRIGMPGGSGSSPHAYVAVIIDPDKARHSSWNGVHDMYDPFGSAASQTVTNVTSLTLLALFQSVKRLSSDHEPRAIYGCLV